MQTTGSEDIYLIETVFILWVLLRELKKDGMLHWLILFIFNWKPHFWIKDR